MSTNLQFPLSRLLRIFWCKKGVLLGYCSPILRNLQCCKQTLLFHHRLWPQDRPPPRQVAEMSAKSRFFFTPSLPEINWSIDEEWTMAVRPLVHVVPLLYVYLNTKYFRNIYFVVFAKSLIIVQVIIPAAMMVLVNQQTPEKHSKLWMK